MEEQSPTTMGQIAASRARKVLLAACAIVAALLVVAPAAAMAVTRFADPNGVTTGSNCTNPDPAAAANPACSLERAVETVAIAGDDVVVATGNYSLTDPLQVNIDVAVHGTVGQPLPVISTTADNGVFVNGTLSDVRIEHTGNFNAIFTGSTVERVFAHTDGSTSCGLVDGALIRDSVCWSEAGGGAGYGVLFAHGSATWSADLRNVTAAATAGSGSGITVDTSTGNVSLEAKNTIARGAAGPGAFDAEASVGAGGTATLTFEHSNYDSEAETGGAGATITNPGTGTNQDAAVNAPLLADPIAGNFHQLASSPTVNAGGFVDLIGTADLDGEARIAGGAPDIGADEFVAPATTPTADTTPPETEITKQPPNKGKRNRVVYRFTSEPGAVFLCKLDRRPLAPCMSPFRKKVKDGKHKFSVVAQDQAGNVDPTPDRDKFKVVG